MYKMVIPECYIDSCLVNVLLQAPDKRGVNHGKGVSSVIMKMRSKFDDKFSVGIIDKDKKQLGIVNREFEVINNNISDYAVLLRHKNQHHYLVQICPESESWICRVCDTLGIDLSRDYDLPATPERLSAITKSVVSNYDKGFASLFKNMVKKSEEANFTPVLKIRNWLQMLTEKQYTVDINELRR